MPGECMSKCPDFKEWTKPTSAEEITHQSQNAIHDNITKTNICNANTTLNEKDTNILLQKLKANFVAAVAEIHKLYTK